MKKPFLSTAFSENGKKAKKRIEGIFSVNKKMSIILVLVVLLITAAAGAFFTREDVGIIGGADGPTSIYVEDTPDLQKSSDSLYSAKLKYIGNASGVGKIMQILGQKNIGEWSGMELQTTQEPYGVIRRYTTAMPKDITEMKKQAAVMICLIENADFVRYVFPDGEAEFTRDELDREFGNLAEFSKSRKEFKKLYDSLYDDGGLEARISKAILEHNSENYLDGECMAEGHITLGTKKTKDTQTVYLIASYGEYSFQNDNFVKESGSGAIPTKIVFNNDGSVAEYEEPRDGSDYIDSIKEMFPIRYLGKALSADDYYDDCLKQEHQYAQNYLNSISRSAKIGEYKDFEHKSFRDYGVSTEASNKLIDDKRISDYLMGIGTCERLENGVRYIYRTDVVKNEVVYTKINYDTNEIIEQYFFDSQTGELLR